MPRHRAVRETSCWTCHEPPQRPPHGRSCVAPASQSAGVAVSIEALAPGLAHHIVNTLGWRSLRPLQADAIAPLLAGADAVLLAPTAGGKTEAAMFPLLTAMERGRWAGTRCSTSAR